MRVTQQAREVVVDALNGSGIELVPQRQNLGDQLLDADDGDSIGGCAGQIGLGDRADHADDEPTMLRRKQCGYRGCRFKDGLNRAVAGVTVLPQSPAAHFDAA